MGKLAYKTLQTTNLMKNHPSFENLLSQRHKGVVQFSTVLCIAAPCCVPAVQSCITVNNSCSGDGAKTLSTCHYLACWLAIYAKHLA